MTNFKFYKQLFERHDRKNNENATRLSLKGRKKGLTEMK